MHFFDLASVSHAAEGKNSKELMMINKSLMTLSRCFKSLVDKSDTDQTSKKQNESFMDASRTFDFDLYYFFF